MCGGSAAHTFPRPNLHGLSPRVRGKPLAIVDDKQDAGSIPACAGEAAGRAV